MPQNEMTRCKLRAHKKNVIQNGEGHGCYGCSEALDINTNKWEYLRCRSCPFIESMLEKGIYTKKYYTGFNDHREVTIRDENGNFFREWQE